MDLGAEVTPTIDRSHEAEGLRTLDRPVECDPCHHFRMGEMLTFSADLPDAVVYERPDLFKVGKKGTLKIPSLCDVLKTTDTPQMQGVHDLTKNIYLQLIGGGVADPHGL
jgi:hypothetical protein